MKDHYKYEHNGRVGNVLKGHVCRQDFLQECKQFSMAVVVGGGESKKISIQNYV